MSFSSNLPGDIFDTESLPASPESGRGGVIVGEEDIQTVLAPAIRSFTTVDEQIKLLRKERLRLCAGVNDQIRILTGEKNTCERTITDILRNGSSAIRGIVLDNGSVFTTRTVLKKKRRSQKTKEEALKTYLSDSGMDYNERTLSGIMNAMDGPITETHKLFLSKQSGGGA